MLGLGDADGNKRNYSANFRYKMIPFLLHLFVMETTMKVSIFGYINPCIRLKLSRISIL
ncbi:hypothetical protein Hdeb2414_s0010g00355581 [Helianthus debilis subsp. tardiflorus]